MKGTLCAASLAVLIAAIPAPAKAASILINTTGCQSLEDTVRVDQVNSSGDHQGATDLLLALIKAGRCRRFEAGEAVTIEFDVAGIEGACVIPRGGTDCYWIVRAFVSKDR